MRTQGHKWSQCDELLNVLACSQQNLLTLGKSVIRFGMGRRWQQ